MGRHCEVVREWLGSGGGVAGGGRGVVGEWWEVVLWREWLGSGLGDGRKWPRSGELLGLWWESDGGVVGGVVGEGVGGESVLGSGGGGRGGGVGGEL